MERRGFTISSSKNPAIKLQVIKGHFTTSSSHISHYIDVSELKSGAAMARNAACELALPYLQKTPVDILVCMDGTEVIAAYLAEELLKSEEPENKDSAKNIHVVTPMNNVNGQLIFHHNVQEKIRDRNVLLVVASVSTGKTIRRAMECISYYGGSLAGIASLFSAVSDIEGHKVNTLFTRENIPDYRFYRSSECELCRDNRMLDAIVNSEGYTRI